MRHKLYTSLVILAAAMILLSTKSIAQNLNHNFGFSFSSIAVSNLINGINSSNAGLSKSSIYFAGLYKVHEASSTLVKILTDRTRDRWIRVYAALSLYNIGETGAYNEIQKLAANEDDLKVRNICAAIYAEYLNRLQASSN